MFVYICIFIIWSMTNNIILFYISSDKFTSFWIIEFIIDQVISEMQLHVVIINEAKFSMIANHTPYMF